MKCEKVFFAILLISVSVAGCNASGNTVSSQGIEQYEGTGLDNASVSSDDSDVSSDPITEMNPYIPSIIIPKARIEVQGESGPKVYVPLEFETGNIEREVTLLQEIRKDLPVITYYEFDDYSYDFEIVFYKLPEYAVYTLYDEDIKEVYSKDSFSLPLQEGGFILRIDASWTEENGEALVLTYFVKIIVGGPREQCIHADWYHGGGGGLVLYEGFNELFDLHDLLELDDKTLEKHLSVYYSRGEDRWICPCFLKTRSDVQNLFSWMRLNEVRVPFSDSIPLREILIRDRYADIYARYVIGDMIFNFILSPAPRTIIAEDIFELWKENSPADVQIELITTVDDINIYIIHFLDDDPRVTFVLSVNGAYVEVEVSIPCTVPIHVIRSWA